MIFQHARFQIWNQNQHPFIHNTADFSYSNPALPNVSNLESALDYICAVIYPKSKPAVANQAALPADGNSINDYRIVSDDGDGKAAGYRWEQREGEATPTWHKVMDVDWASDSILSGWQSQTLDLYVVKRGHDDTDGSGNVISGLYAGQQIFGGATANSNLTLSANSGDGVAAQTGYVQVTDSFRPISDSVLSLGLSTHRWLKGWFSAVEIGSITISSNQISSATEQVDFNSSSINTNNSITVGTLSLSAGEMTDSSGVVFMGDCDLYTNLTIHCNTIDCFSPVFFEPGSGIADFIFTDGQIACASGSVDFGALHLVSTGDIEAGRVLVDSLKLDGATLSVTEDNANLILSANGTGKISLSHPVLTQSQVSIENNKLSISGVGSCIELDDLRLDGSTISVLAADENLTLSPNGTGYLKSTASVVPESDNAHSLGSSSFSWASLWLGGDIKYGSLSFKASHLMNLRNSSWRDSAGTEPPVLGDALIWNGSQWLAGPAVETILHEDLDGLNDGDSGHTQFALLSGRSGGQLIIGGTQAGENLSLESTSDATKGFIQAKDTVRPFSDAAYSGGWAGKDLGHANHRWNDVYSAGEFKGFRAENVASLPSPSVQNVGRIYYYTLDQSLYVDTGANIKQVGGTKVFVDTVWNGSDVLKDVTVSGVDARYSLWQLKDNTNDFDVVYCSVKATSATNVRITVGTALPAGTYRLVGV